MKGHGHKLNLSNANCIQKPHGDTEITLWEELQVWQIWSKKCQNCM